MVITFQQGLVNHLIFPLCQSLVEVLPALIKQNVELSSNEKYIPISSLCDKLSGELPKWSNIFTQNEAIKFKMIQDFNVIIPNANSTNPVTKAPCSSNNSQQCQLEQ